MKHVGQLPEWLIAAITLLAIFNSAHAAELELVDDPTTITSRLPPDFPKTRMLADFNADGIKDVAVGVGMAGNAGDGFIIYAGTGNGKFQKLGEIFAHPKAISIEHLYTNTQHSRDNQPRMRIWVYLRNGGVGGSLGYHEISRSGDLGPLKSLDIYPGITRVSKELYEVLFNASDEEIVFQLFSESDKMWKVSYKVKARADQRDSDVMGKDGSAQ